MLRDEIAAAFLARMARWADDSDPQDASDLIADLQQLARSATDPGWTPSCWCGQCGSARLSFAMWTDARTGEQTVGCGSDGGYVFCEDCEDEVDTVTTRREAAELRLARREHDTESANYRAGYQSAAGYRD
jgi:hypothetical protein